MKRNLEKKFEKFEKIPKNVQKKSTKIFFFNSKKNCTKVIWQKKCGKFENFGKKIAKKNLARTKFEKFLKTFQNSY